MFIAILRHEPMRHGGVNVARSGDRIVGAAAWMPPDTWRSPSAAQQLRSAPGYMRAFGRRIGAASALGRVESGRVGVMARKASTS